MNQKKKMTDEKFVFIEDLRDRKSVSRGSLHKKRGSKSKKCTLPSDFLTPAQKRKMNGEVNMYKIGQPITWEEFKSYPHEMQMKWVESFVERFGCTDSGMAIVLGVSKNTVCSYRQKKDLMVSGGGYFSAKKEKLIREWMAENGAAAPEPAAPIVKEKPVAPAAPVVKTEVMPYFVNVLKEGRLSLEGDANEICQTLFGIFRDAKLHLEINFSVVNEPEPAVGAEDFVPVAEQEESEDDGRLNLNTARFDELRRVGFSANLAAQIVARRRENPFESKEELKEIVGLTEDHYERLESQVRV